MSLDINAKMQEIKKAVEGCGVRVADVHFDTSLQKIERAASVIPYIAHLTLDVTFDLELQPKNQQRLT